LTIYSIELYRAVGGAFSQENFGQSERLVAKPPSMNSMSLKVRETERGNDYFAHIEHKTLIYIYSTIGLCAKVYNKNDGRMESSFNVISFSQITSLAANVLPLGDRHQN
jgi:hypothetical protein